MSLKKHNFDYWKFQTQKDNGKTNPMCPQSYDSVIKICHPHYIVSTTKRGSTSPSTYHWIPGMEHNAWNTVGTSEKNKTYWIGSLISLIKWANTFIKKLNLLSSMEVPSEITSAWQAPELQHTSFFFPQFFPVYGRGNQLLNTAPKISARSSFPLQYKSHRNLSVNKIPV